MTAKKKPTLKEEVAILRQEVESSANNQEMLEEALTVLENQLTDQGWIRLFGGSKELSKSALNTLYDLGRAYWLKNPLIRRAVEIQGLYVFAQGMTIQGDHAPVDDVVQRFFMDRKNYNSISSHQAWIQNERDLALSGNLFFALFTEPNVGRVIVRTIPFYEVADIVCNPEDQKEPWFYKREFAVTEFDEETGNQTTRQEVQYYPDWKYDPDDKPDRIGAHPVNWDSPVYHIKTNCLPDMKYGVPEIYSAIDWAAAYKKFLENWGKLTEAYARFAWGITTKGGQAKVSAAKARMESLLAKTDPNTETSIESLGRTKQLPVGSVFTSTEGVKLDAIRTQGATTSMEDARRLMLMVSSASGIPEQILTGDPSTGNLATAKAMERPLELQFRNRQTLWSDVWWDLCQYVIDQAIEAGRLEGGQREDPYTQELTYYLDQVGEDGEPITRDVTVTFPPLLEHDVMQTVAAIISAATIDNKTLAGTMDRKTMAGLLLRALKVENPDEILEGLPDEPKYDRVTAPPAPDAGGYGGFGAIDYTTESLDNLLADTIKDVQRAARDLREADDGEGKWVTINGAHVLIKDGETAGQAFKRTTGKNLQTPQGKSGVKPDTTQKARASQIKKTLNQKPKDVEKNMAALYKNSGQDHQMDIMTRTDISPDELDAVGTFQSAGYVEINAHMRGIDRSNMQASDPELANNPALIQEHITKINSAIDKSPTPDGLSLYRGVSGEYAQSLDRAKVGDIIQEKGFQSFTADPNVADKFSHGVARPVENGPAQEVSLMIQYVTGSNDKALPIVGGTAGFEKEFLMRPGKWKIVDSVEYKSGYNQVRKVIQLAAV